MDDMMTQLGVGGILAILMVREVLNFLKSKQPTQNGETQRLFVKLDQVTRHVADLHKWHDKTDEDGVPVWYIRRSFEDAVEKLADAVTQLAASSSVQTKVLEDLVRKVEVE